MRAVRPSVLPALIPLVLVGCASGEQTIGSGSIVTDSAGIAIVHHGRSIVEAADSLELVEVLRIGTLDGPSETQFFLLAGAVEREGEIYVLDRGHSAVRVFDTSGRFLRAFGRDGDGPGEFRRPSVIEFLGDTLVVLGRRLTLLDTEGTPFATAPAQLATADGFLMRTYPTSVGWIGSWMSRSDQNMPRGRAFRETISLHGLDRTTAERVNEVFSYPRPETRVSRGEFPFYVSPYFQALPTHAIGLDGAIYYTPGGAYLIQVRDGTTGHLLRRITADPRPAPITRGLLDRIVEEDRTRVRDAPPGSETSMFGRVIDEKLALGVADNLPVLGRIYVSESGWLLVDRLDLDPDPVTRGDPTTWDLFDPEGRLSGRLALDADTRILRLTDDGFLGVVRDELDVQAFVKYRFAGM